MVGCTVPFCNNSSEKGYIMKILPRNTQRREQWMKNINSKYKWTPSNHSYLCESIPTHHIPDCHKLRSKLFKKFATMRLKLKNKRRIVLPDRKYYDSKSMAMHHSFK